MGPGQNTHFKPPLLEHVPDRVMEQVNSLLLHWPVASPQLAFGLEPEQAAIPPLGVGIGVGCGVGCGVAVGAGVGVGVDPPPPAGAANVQPPVAEPAMIPWRAEGAALFGFAPNTVTRLVVVVTGGVRSRTTEEIENVVGVRAARFTAGESWLAVWRFSESNN